MPKNAELREFGHVQRRKCTLRTHDHKAAALPGAVTGFHRANLLMAAYRALSRNRMDAL